MEHKEQSWTWQLGLAPDISGVIEPGTIRHIALHILDNDKKSRIGVLLLSQIAPVTPEAALERQFYGLGQLVTGEDVECLFVLDDARLAQHVDITIVTPLSNDK